MVRKKPPRQETAAPWGNLAWCYDSGQGVEHNAEEAVRWYRAGVQAGNLRCMHNLGCCYEHGEGVEKNMEEALCLHRAAAEGGYVFHVCTGNLL